MKPRCLTALAIALTTPIQAQSLDFGNGVSLSGKLQLEHVHFGGDGTNELTHLFADLGRGWRHPTDGAFGLGGDVSLVGNDATGSGDDRQLSGRDLCRGPLVCGSAGRGLAVA